jgi:hypothetical protein
MWIARRWTVLLGVFLTAAGAWGQLYSGSVTGLVTDPQSAVLPGARVVLMDQDKGTSFTSVTDGGGRYLFRGVPPAIYKITTSAQGFGTQERAGIRIDVDQNATVNFSLPIGSATTAVTVSGETPLLSTEDAATGQVIERSEIDALPLLNREVMSLAYLTPGVVSPQNHDRHLREQFCRQRKPEFGRRCAHGWGVIHQLRAKWQHPGDLVYARAGCRSGIQGADFKL